MGEHASRDVAVPHELLFEQHPHPMWVVDAATLAIASANDAAVAHYRHSRDELLAMTIRDLRAPGEPSQLEDWLARADGGPRTRFGTRHCTNGGAVIEVEVYATRIETPEGQRALVCAVDVTERKRAEAAAVAAERRLQALIDKGFDGVVLNAADGTIRYVSPAFTRILGYERTEAIGQHGATWLHPDDLARETEGLRSTMQTPGAICTTVMRNRHRDGSWRWVESTTTNLLHDPNVQAIAATFRDVTERVLAEQALAEAHARMEHVLSTTSAIMFTLRGTSGDSGATFMSENVFAVLGYEAREFTEERCFWLEHVHPDDRERLLAESRGNGARHVQEFRFLHRDGHYVWLHTELVETTDESGHEGITGYCFDITARKELEEALRGSERSFRALLDRLPSGVIVHRSARIVYANRTAASLLGHCGAEELRGASLYGIAPPEEHDEIRARIEALESKARTYNPPRAAELVRRDGSRVAVEVEALLVDFDGEPTVLLLVRDLTERRDMLARMAVADRMRSVGMLAAGVAHEINNPLTYVLGNLSLVVDELRRPARRLSPERIAQLLADAHDGALRVRDVVRDLRVLSRADGELVGAVELRDVLESCLKMASNEVRFRARLVSRLDPTPPVRGTASRLGQVFLNLLINAAHSIAEGHPDDNAITVTTRPLDPQTVVVEITDTGCGIPPSLIGRIFDPFFTTKPPGVGTGLGLAICHGIIKTLGGNIDVQSEPGRGSTVRVTLPVAPPVETREERRAPRVAVPRRGSVLVVDDEPAIGSALRTLLQLEHDVVTVTRAVDALARIEAGERYDVVLCDVMMPEMSGVELFAAVERSNPGIASRFVFITGGAFTEASRAFLDGNKNPCLEKPLTLDTLRKTIAQVLGDP